MACVAYKNETLSWLVVATTTYLKIGTLAMVVAARRPACIWW